MFCSEKVVNTYYMRADKRAKKPKWKCLPVCRKWEQRGNAPEGCVSIRSLVCGINRWRLCAKRPISAELGGKGQSSVRHQQHPAVGGWRRSWTSWKAFNKELWYVLGEKTSVLWNTREQCQLWLPAASGIRGFSVQGQTGILFYDLQCK